MHPFRPQWQYDYSFPSGADASNAYAASYYHQMYAGVPAAPPPPPPPSDTTPAYSSDFSSGSTGFTMPPPTNHYQHYQKRYNKPHQVKNVQQVPLNKRPPPPPPQETPRAGLSFVSVNVVSVVFSF